MTAKLLTPVMYEQSISWLNLMKFFTSDVKIKQDIDYPVLTKSLLTENGIPEGRLLRCDNNGAVLTNRYSVAYNAVISNIITTDGEYEYWIVDFGRAVDFVLLKTTPWLPGNSVQWVNSGHDKVFGNYIGIIPFYIHFNNQIMNFFTDSSSGIMNISVYGFYK